MSTSDRLLWAIGVGAVAVAIIAVVLVVSRGQPTYMAETGPEAVAYNYVLAMILRDHERALGYLSPTLPGRPKDDEELAAAVFRHDLWVPEGEEVHPEAAVVKSASAEQATIQVKLRHFGEPGLFGEAEWQSDVQLLLRREDGRWRIVDGQGLWDDCWRDPDLEQCGRRGAPRPLPAP